MKNKFRLPHEIKKDKETKLPVSIRLTKTNMKKLKQISKAEKIKLATLIESVLEDYIAYVEEQKGIGNKK